MGRTNRAWPGADPEPEQAGAAPEARGGGELEALERIAALLAPAPPGEVWIGDDAAVVAPPAGPLLLTVDVVVEGVHADLALVSLEDLGWRSVSAAVSDIAAMGGLADRLLVSVAAPPTTDLERIYRGITESALHHGAAVVGGDLSTAAYISVAVTVVGHVPSGVEPALRSGATAGDVLLVTGPLGAAAAGFRILRDRRPATGTEMESERSLVEAHRRPVAAPGRRGGCSKVRRDGDDRRVRRDRV